MGSKRPSIAPRGLSAAGTAILDDQEAFLLAHGWKRNQSTTRWPWEWYKPPLRGTFYRLKDALDIERSREHK